MRQTRHSPNRDMQDLCVEAKEALIKAIGEPWPALVDLFEAEAAKVRAYLAGRAEG